MTLLEPVVKETQVAYESRVQDGQSQISTSPGEASLDVDETSFRSRPNIFAILDVPGNWSGKGQHVEFARNEPLPLEQGEFLGRGAFADVHEVTCKGIVVARKQIYCHRRMKIKDVKRELDVLKKLSHDHVVTLLGSYTQNNMLGLLLYPAAACDLGMFLDELDEEQRSEATEFGEGLSKLMDRIGLPVSLSCARERLNKVYGCLANAIKYLHDHDVRHKDIKPRNVLLDRNDGLYITDFGLSRDTTGASSSVTNGIERGTYKYCAPEVARYEPRGRAADIYSLGCVFLEINTVQRRLSLTTFENFRNEDEDRSFQNTPQKLLDWMSDLRGIKIDSPDTGVFDMMDIVQKMISPAPGDRPLIAAVCSSLYVLSDLVYFGRCCATPRYQTLIQRNIELKEQSAKFQKVVGETEARIQAICTAHEAEKAAMIKQSREQLDQVVQEHDQKMGRLRDLHNLHLLTIDTDQRKEGAALDTELHAHMTVISKCEKEVENYAGESCSNRARHDKDEANASRAYDSFHLEDTQCPLDESLQIQREPAEASHTPDPYSFEDTYYDKSSQIQEELYGVKDRYYDENGYYDESSQIQRELYGVKDRYYDENRYYDESSQIQREPYSVEDRYYDQNGYYDECKV